MYLPRKRDVLSFKRNYWPALITIFLKICKLLSKLINSTVKNMQGKSVESRQKDLTNCMIGKKKKKTNWKVIKIVRTLDREN